MVPMEVINLDDTGNPDEGKICTCTTPAEVADTTATPKKSIKRKTRKVSRSVQRSAGDHHEDAGMCTCPSTSRAARSNSPKKKLNRKVRKRDRLLSLIRMKELFNNRRTNSQPCDNDNQNGTLTEDKSPNVIKLSAKCASESSLVKDGMKVNNTKLSPSRRKRRRSSTVVVIDSDDDDSIILSKKPCQDNNVDDVLCLSDNSVIELSDSEDVGVVAGSVETAQAGWKNHKQKVNNENARNAPKNSKNNNNLNIHVLRQKLLQVLSPRKNRNGEPGTSRDKPEIPYKLEPKSRHSISYLPPSDSTDKQGPRPIVIDGSNVAFGHGRDKFSSRGIEICVDFFLRRKHKEIRAFVPQFRRRHPSTIDFEILDKLEKEGHLIYTPSRKVDGKRITSYDDRYIVEYAAKTGGVIVSRDNYQDLLTENPAWGTTINFRMLQYTFVGDMIMFPQDPLGRGGPSLDRFLKF